MLLRRIIHIQILLLLCPVCRLTLAFPTQTPSTYDNVQSLQVNIPHSGLVFGPLGSSISIPCFVSLSSTPTTSSSSPVEPRVKWSVVSNGVETQILVARGQRVKINEAYRDRAALLNHSSSPDDLTLWLGDLRSSDSGHYRCEVQQGLEDASDLVELKVKGVVFHYRDALGRYAFSFHQAQRACEAIGAEIASADQLLAAYYDGYEQCDAGWLSDQSVRYPIQVPREGCYGDMDGQPGVRNYGTMDPDDLFDVYCYLEQIDGEVVHDSVPQQLSFDEAQAYCRAAGAELATTAQLYLAWSEGLDRCSPGWLSDGSVRYPIKTPRERCGGPQPGVKTLYRFSNQTGFPEPSSLHDVYCFRDYRDAPTGSPMDYMATEPEDFGQDVVILTEADEELRLNQHAEQVEREAQSVLESFPFVSQQSTEEIPVDTDPTVMSDTTESSLNATSTANFLIQFDETSSPAEISSQSQNAAALMTSTSSSTETYDFSQNTSALLSVYNETDSQQTLNLSFDQFEFENTTGFPEPSYEPHTHNRTEQDMNPEDYTQPSERPIDSQEIQETDFGLNRSQANYSKTDSYHTQEDNILEATSVTADMVQVKMEEATIPTWQTSFSTQSPREEGEVLTITSQAPDKNRSSLWLHLDGSGDISQENDVDVEAITFTPTLDSSTSSLIAHPSPSTSASSAPADSQAVLPDPTSSPGSLVFNIFSTVAQLWESSTSKQEESTGSETEDTVSTEKEDKQMYLIESEDNFGVSSATTESPESSNTSQLPPDSTTARYQTSSYRVSLKTAITGHEEASGEEPRTVTEVLGEDVEDVLTPEENITVIRIPEEEVKISPTIEEGAELSFSLEQEVQVSAAPEENSTVVPNFEIKVAPSVEVESEVSFSLEEDSTVVPIHEEETTVTPTFEEEANVAPTVEEFEVSSTVEEEVRLAPISEEVEGSRSLEVEVASTIKEEVAVAPTLEEAEVSPTFEVGANLAPTMEEIATVAPTLDEVEISPTLEGEANVASTIEEETIIVPTLEEETNVSSQLEEEANTGSVLEVDVEEPTASTVLEEEATSVSTLEEETHFASKTEEDFAVFPFDSQTSKWAVLTTTAGPTAAPDASSSTKSTHASAKTTTAAITTTTHWARRNWSPTTKTPRVFHKTTEPQKVTHLIPPVDQGLVDVEFSLTQPPTLLILTNERAAVGGTGKASDACVDDPCLNGGTCTDQNGQVICLCLPTYGGDFCQNDLERCEPGWDKFHGFCYRHYSQRLSWEVAEQHCRMQGAHLVSIMTPEEQNYINSNYKEYQWTGLNDKTIEDDFHWSDGNPLLYENWYRGQPDSYFLSGEDCVVMVWHDNGRWSDVPCNYHLAYTCKKGTSSCGPPPKVRNASIFGKPRQRYETNAVVRYHCAEGFQQRLKPLIRCLSGGMWERPHILCIPEAGGPTQHPEVTSPTDNDSNAAAEDEFEATKETPQYWDIKF
ncbi:brevican core protein-like [Echeneis naucrates]|uniref:brevican core protein-like n=1 Tax=Echeneis naucrates TaxID=173247 RepID=UPI001113EDEC|nr:brevican core protein-like [Echeneis naucrates]